MIYVKFLMPDCFARMQMTLFFTRQLYCPSEKLKDEFSRDPAISNTRGKREMIRYGGFEPAVFKGNGLSKKAGVPYNKTVYCSCCRWT